MKEVFEIIYKYRIEFYIGLTVTLKMTLLIWVIGMSLGSAIGILSAKFKKFIGLPAKVITFFLGGIPVLVFLYWLHYPFQTLLGIQIEGFYTTILALTFINIFLVAEQVRNAVEQFPKDYILSAEVCGFSPFQIIKQIQVPHIIRQILPAIILIQVVMMHSTLFGSLISVDEIFRIASRVNSKIYKPVEVFSSLAFFFLILSLPLTAFSYYIKRKYSYVK